MTNEQLRQYCNDLLAETDLNKRISLKIEQLDSYRKKLRDVYPEVQAKLKDSHFEAILQERIAQLAWDIERSRTEEKEKEAEKKRLRRSDVAIGISIVTLLISGIGVIYSIFLCRFQHANTEAAALPTYRQTPTPISDPTEPASSSTPASEQTATAQPSVSPPESSLP